MGTVQLGQLYGISNKTGKPNESEALKIVTYGVSKGINSIDTAPVYGSSERLIGKFIIEQKKVGGKVPEIITKLPVIDVKGESYKQVYKRVEQQVISSLSHLNRSSIDIYLLHVKFDSRVFDERMINSLRELKKKGMIKKMGASVYNPVQVKKLLELGCFDVVQVPVNVLDQRLIHTGLLDQLAKAKIEVFARSIYLQGLFFLKSDELPDHLKGAKEPLEKFHNLALESGIKPSILAMLFVRDLPGVRKIIVGCETVDQLKRNIERINLPRLPSTVVETAKKRFKDTPELVITPALWGRGSE